MLNVYAPSWRRFALLLAILMVFTAVFAVANPAEAQQANRGGKVGIPVTGTLEDGGTFEGEILRPRAYLGDERQPMLRGVLKGTAVTQDGEEERVRQRFETPLTVVTSEGEVQSLNQGAALQQQQQQPTSCSILFLDLGPIFLDLLGLQVDLSQILLDVSAVPGAGNLLGNLLCAVVGLLDAPGFLAGIINFLNFIFEIGQFLGILSELFQPQ